MGCFFSGSFKYKSAIILDNLSFLYSICNCENNIFLYTVLQSVDNPKVAAFIRRPAWIDFDPFRRATRNRLGSFEIRDELGERVCMLVEYQVFCEFFLI